MAKRQNLAQYDDSLTMNVTHDTCNCEIVKAYAFLEQL